MALVVEEEMVMMNVAQGRYPTRYPTRALLGRLEQIGEDFIAALWIFAKLLIQRPDTTDFSKDYRP